MNNTRILLLIFLLLKCSFLKAFFKKCGTTRSNVVPLIPRSLSDSTKFSSPLNSFSNIPPSKFKNGLSEIFELLTLFWQESPIEKFKRLYAKTDDDDYNNAAEASKYACSVCGYIFDEKTGNEAKGIKINTK